MHVCIYTHTYIQLLPYVYMYVTWLPLARHVLEIHELLTNSLHITQRQQQSEAPRHGQAHRRADVWQTMPCSIVEQGAEQEVKPREDPWMERALTAQHSDSIRIHQCQPIYAHIKNAVCQWQTQRLQRAAHTHTESTHTHWSTHDAHMTSAFVASAQNWGTSQERDKTRRDTQIENAGNKKTERGRGAESGDC